MMQAQLLNLTLDESQWQRDWTVLLSLASQPGEFVCCSFLSKMEGLRDDAGPAVKLHSG